MGSRCAQNASREEVNVWEDFLRMDFGLSNVFAERGRGFVGVLE